MGKSTSSRSAKDTDAPLADAIYQQLLDAIYQGRLLPGSVVNEALLAQEFGVSRGPVREAVRRLQGIQLITRQPYAKSRVISLTPNAALELYQLRMALEGMACGLAAQNMSDEDIEMLLRDLEAQQSRSPTPDDASPAPRRAYGFHERIVRACGNSRIAHALCDDIFHLLRIYRHQCGNTERRDEPHEEHWQILHAIKARNAALAESLMRSHIGRAAGALARRLDLSVAPR